MVIYIFSEFSRKTFKNLNRTKTDTSRWVEYTKALEIIMLKELGKMAL